MDAHTRRLIDAVPRFRGARKVSVTPLEGGITNRILRVDHGGEAFVLRELSPTTEHLGIDRDRELEATRNAAALGIAPEFIHYARDPGVLVVRFAAGEALTPETGARPDALSRVARALATWHGGPELPGSFSPFETVRVYEERAREHGVKLPERLADAVEAAEEIERVVGPPERPAPCHNDLLGGNLLDDGASLAIIDWEYAAMGDPDFDLGNLSAHLELDDDAVARLLEEYDPEGATAAHRARVALFRMASDLRESLWGYLQSGVSTLDFDYPGYATTYLDRFLSAAGSSRAKRWRREVAAGS